MLKLIRPTMQFEKEFKEAVAEMADYYPGTLSPAQLHEMTVEAFIAHCQSMEQRDPDGDLVPSSELWLMDDGEFIGAMSIRHRLNDFLKEFGGHVGYAIRPSKRGHGYGTMGLSLALDFLKERGVTRVFVTCDDDNLASKKIIESNGGVLQDTVEIPQNPGKSTMRWWIDNSTKE